MKLKYTYIAYTFLSMINMNFYCASDQEGILVRSTVSADQLLAQKGAGTFVEMQRLISLYGPLVHQDEKSIVKSFVAQDPVFYTHLLRDIGYLLEGFFAHCGMLLGLPLFAGIDTTAQQIIDPAIFFATGVVKPQAPEVTQTSLSAPRPQDAPPPLSSTTASSGASQQSTTISQVCGSLFHASRYMRIITDSLNAATTLPADLCAGIIVINNGWVCSLTMPSINSDRIQQKGNLFCLPAGISGQTSDGNILGFVKNHTIDFIPFSEGIDQWSVYNNTRTMKLVVADDVGSTAFVSSQLGNGGSNALTLQVVKDGTITLNDAQGNVISRVGLTKQVKDFYKSLGGPWAVIIEMNNQDFNKGDLFPTFEIKGLVKLNYAEFPLQFQAFQSQKIGQPFSVESLIRAPEKLLEEAQMLSRYTQATIENNFTYGACKDYTISVSLPVFKKNDLYVTPLNAAYAKIKGALGYDWETKKYTIQDAFDGINKIMSVLFFRRHNLIPSYMMHSLNKDSNVLLI